MDGMIFPSVPQGHKSLNFALHPNFVKKHLRLEKVFEFIYEKSTGSIMNLHLMKVVEIHDERLKWRESTIIDSEDFKEGVTIID